jgi:hypothetical protein
MPLDVNGNSITSGTVKMFNDTNIVLSGLTYAFDAGIGNSYPGSGTSWYEWVSNGTTATLTNGPTQSNDGGGSILLDGGNDYVEVPTRSIGAPWTIQMWIKPSSSGGGLHSHWSGGPVGHGFFLDANRLAFAYYNGDWRYVYCSASNSVPTGVWSNVAVSLSGSNPINFWVNGRLTSTQTVTNGVGGFAWGSIGILWGWNYFQGHIAQCLTYSGTNIGQAGIFQNYQSTKVRFGLA